jgi:ribosomal protein S18 acetylase RimI-like enzyme
MRTVSIATCADEGRIISVMTLAFANDPACRRLYPDPLQYLTYFPEFVRLYGGPAFDHGGAHWNAESMGAALWLPPDIRPDEEKFNALLERSLAETAKPELFEVYAQMKQHHPQEPHWFLPLIGVDPFCQSQGIGAALLQFGLTACDRDHTLAYLDSTNPRNIPLYERYGFQVLGTIQVGQHPPVYPMLRRPR